MRNVGKIIILLLITLIINGCQKSKGYSEISYNDLMKKIEKEDNFIIMIGSSKCTHCDSFKLTLEEISKKYKIDIKYIDVLKLSKGEDANLKLHFPYNGTPTTINVISGKGDDQTKIIGEEDYYDLKMKLVKWGYIKE